MPNSSQKLPRSGTSNQKTITTRTISASIRPMMPYGSSLPMISSQPAERRHVQLLERADLALAHDRHRRQVRRDDQQQQREDARQHEIAALERRVEPDAHARLDAAAASVRRGARAARRCSTISCA